VSWGSSGVAAQVTQVLHQHEGAIELSILQVLIFGQLPQNLGAGKWSEQAASDGFPCYPLFERDANLNSLRQDPRYVALLARLRRQWEYYKTIS
jgi:hypothetical protein